MFCVLVVNIVVTVVHILTTREHNKIMPGLKSTTVLLCAAAVHAQTTGTNSSNCFLKKDHSAGDDEFDFTYQEPAKPFPSLTQCYKNNQRACCVSAHDAYIESMYGQILSATCLRQFSYLEQYYCLGCNPDQGKWVVGNEYTYVTDSSGNAVPGTDGLPQWNFDMRICTSFMEFLYDPDEEVSNYEKCGLLSDGVGYLPTSRYFNASQFIAAIKPPYFEHVNWVEVNDQTDSSGEEFEDTVECVVPEVGETVDASTYECCFSAGSQTTLSAAVVGAAALGALAMLV